MTDSRADKHPLVVDAYELKRQPGSSLRRTVVVPVEDAMGNDVLKAKPNTQAEIELLLESVIDGILATGNAEFETEGLCVRCLDGIDRPENVTFRQFFTYPGVAVEEAEEESEDIVEITGNFLDLRPAFRDAVLLALPLTPTCRSDCPGLCPECGQRLADEPDHGHEKQDPRWSALSGWQPDHQPEGE